MIRMSVATFVLATGCMMPQQGPKSGVVATGEQLNVVDDVKVWTTTYKEKVAETEYKDSAGNVVGTGSVYQDKTAVHTMKIWYPVQGSQQIADEDFFHIAGDKDSEKATLDMRADGAHKHKIGLYTIGGSLAAMLVGYLVPLPTAGREILVLGGSFGMIGGYYYAYMGAHEMNPETHAVDRSVAEKAAIQYNQAGGKTVGMSYTKSF